MAGSPRDDRASLAHTGTRRGAMIRRLAADLVVDQGCELGEGPCWDAASNTLLWVDIHGRYIYRLHGDGAVSSIQLEWLVGAVAPRAGGGLVAAVANGFALLDDEGRVERVISVEADLPQHRMNDAKVDRQGRCWAGTLHVDFLPGTGALYRLDPDGTVERVLDGLALANGFDWSDDGETMYVIDSLTRRVDLFDVDKTAGRLYNRRPFVELPDALGLPDGLTLDCEGNVWVACWDGGVVRAWDSDGAAVAEIAVPVARVTSCAFGGSNLDRLYITTAKGTNPPHPRPAGGVFAVDPGVRGRARDPFAG